MSVKYILFILCMLASHNKTETPKPIRLSSNNPRVFATCVENIGCIDTNEKWYDDKYRPVNLEPLDRHTIRTEFLLLKHANNSSKEILYDILTLKPESVGISGYRDEANTIFLIHDFTSNGHTGWIKHITIAFSEKIDSNIISVDWEAGAEPPFDQAIANARVVALEIKVFIEMLKNSFSLKEYNVHLIGHGVGAHIAGYVGKSMPGIGRITGLDPTGPRFENMPPVVRLDANDSMYVEVLHTDAFNGRSQGTKEPIGHADFYFNNADRQPGCEEATHLPKFSDIRRDTLKEGAVLPACSHKRSFKYYINAIVGSDCKFVGISCPSYDFFLVGNCTYCGDSNCAATFGLTEPAECIKYKRYYLVTDSEPPYCLHTYIVNVTIDNNPKAKTLDGSFEFIFVDENKKVTNATGYLDKATRRTFLPGQKYTLVVYTSPPKIGKIEEAKVKWMHNKKLLETFRPSPIFVNELSIKRVPFTDEKPVVSLLCPAMSNEIKNNDFIEFVLCSNITAATTSATSAVTTVESTVACTTSHKKATPATTPGTTSSTTSSTTLKNTLHTTTVSSKNRATTSVSPQESTQIHSPKAGAALNPEGEEENNTMSSHTAKTDEHSGPGSKPEFEHVKTVPQTKDVNLEETPGINREWYYS